MEGRTDIVVYRNICTFENKVKLSIGATQFSNKERDKQTNKKENKNIKVDRKTDRSKDVPKYLVK